MRRSLQHPIDLRAVLSEQRPPVQLSGAVQEAVLHREGLRRNHQLSNALVWLALCLIRVRLQLREQVHVTQATRRLGLAINDRDQTVVRAVPMQENVTDLRNIAIQVFQAFHHHPLSVAELDGALCTSYDIDKNLLGRSPTGELHDVAHLVEALVIECVLGLGVVLVVPSEHHDAGPDRELAHLLARIGANSEALHGQQLVFDVGKDPAVRSQVAGLCGPVANDEVDGLLRSALAAGSMNVAVGGEPPSDLRGERAGAADERLRPAAQDPQVQVSNFPCHRIHALPESWHPLEHSGAHQFQVVEDPLIFASTFLQACHAHAATIPERSRDSVPISDVGQRHVRETNRQVALIGAHVPLPQGVAVHDTFRQAGGPTGVQNREDVLGDAWDQLLQCWRIRHLPPSSHTTAEAHAAPGLF
mmetsp:Transcript_7307/g.26530  ORF Transcript_7307/g.26530 Transcript_7307/m.26530 type:complete len:417 (+) Transcript_7307:1531-2781(+)